MFHVSQLRKYVPDLSHIIEVESVQLRADLTFQAKPAKIIDRSVKSLRNKTISLVKVLWDGQSPEEATWELEEDLRKLHPDLF